MFIRKTRKKDLVTKKEYFNYQLVESYRADRGPRQRILLNLGSTPDNFSIEDQKLLANRIEELLIGVEPLLPYPHHIEQLAQTSAKQIIKKGGGDTAQKNPLSTESNYHAVDLDSLEHDQARTVGIEHIAYETIKTLGLDQKLLDLGFTKRQKEIALGVIVGRLTCPGSERATHAWLQHKSAIEELLDTDFSRLSLDLVYRIGDQLLKHKNVIEEHLTEKEKDMFSFDNTIMLYDLTNTYFEGTAKKIPDAARGRSKEKRTDCPLVTLGLVINRQGFPVRSQMLPGNVSEPSTLQNAIEKLSDPSDNKPIIVMDAGIATEENLLYLRQEGFCYIVASRQRSCDFPEDLQFDIVKETQNVTVRAASLKDSETEEINLYCHSSEREKKEKAMRSLLQERFEQDLKTAADALDKTRGTKSYPKVLERIGRLKEKHKRIASYYTIKVNADKDNKIVLAITWERKEVNLDNRFQGGYLLRVYGLNWSTKQLWKTYVMLTEVEEAFRCLKSDLGLRPVFHQTGSRVNAHLFITLLAYHIMQTVLYRLKSKGIHLRWKTLQLRMETQIRVTTIMRLKTNQTVHIRTSTKPESFHREIYNALGISHEPGRRIKTFI